MKHIVRKSCAILAAACLLATMVPAAALAEVATLADEPSSGTVAVDENWTLAYTVEDGVATIDYAESYPDGTADLTIPATVPDPEGGDDVPVTGIGEGAFCGNNAYEAYYHEGADHLAKVTLSDSVRFIETRAFNSTSMTSLAIGTGVVYVESYGISYNEAMESLDFADGAHPEYFANGAFRNNTAIEELSIPAMLGSEFRTQWNTRLGESCFAACSSLAKVTFEPGDPNRGSQYSNLDPFFNPGWLDGCPIEVLVNYLEELDLGNDGPMSGKPSTCTTYNALFFYESVDAEAADTDRTAYKDCVLLKEGTSLTSIAAGTLEESDYYGDTRVPDVSTYDNSGDMVWGFPSLLHDGDEMMGPGSSYDTDLGTLDSPGSAYPVSRADMNYAHIVFNGADILTTGSGIGNDWEVFNVYYLYSTGVDLSGIVACSPDGKEIDADLYDLVIAEEDYDKWASLPENSIGYYSVYAQGVDAYQDAQTSLGYFVIVKHQANVNGYISSTATHGAAQASYQMATELEDPAFVVMAPASDWRACMVATALAGAGKGLAVFSDGTDTDDTMFQAILRAHVDHLTFVGTTSALGASAIERAKILVNDDEGAFNYFDLSDPAALAVDVCEKVAKSGPTSDNPHEWGDTAILMSPGSCLYTASVAQYAYAAAAPVLFTASDGSISTDTKEALSRFDNVVVAGDTKAVPASTVSSLEAGGAIVTRICDESQAYASSLTTADLMTSEFDVTCSTISVADASSPACVMAASQLSALESGICYACSASAETKACQQRIEDVHGIDNVDTIYVTGPFASDSKVAERMESLWNDPMDTDFAVGDTFEDGGLIFKADSSSAATLSSVADSSLTSVNASTASYGNVSYTVNALSASALANNKKITSVTLGNVTSIPANACKNCTALKTASFAKATKLGSGAFSGCSSLTSVSIPKVTSIPASAFKGLKKLSNVTAGSVTSIGTGAFANCTALKSASFGSAKTVGSNAFSACTSLTSVKLPKVTTIPASAFSGDKKLKSASFGTVTSIGASAFSGCAALTSAPVAKATSIGASAFSGCTSLKTVKASSVKTIGASAFKGAKKLKKANLASKKLKSIGASAFSSCKKLKKVTIKSAKLKKVGKKAFKGTAKKMTIKVPKAKVKKYKKLLTKAGISKKAKVKA